MGGSPVPDLLALSQRHTGLAVLSEIRRGGQKSVWKVSYGGRPYALKVMLSAPEVLERAKREINIMRECQSPYLVSFGPLDLQYLHAGGKTFIYYLEEFVDGTPLDAVQKPLALKLCKTLGLHLVRAIQCLWQKRYVHRDIKPGNVMLRAEGQSFVLLDVGFALDLATSSLTGAGLVVGTQLYLSPDQIRLAKRQLDFRSDLHAVGLCMYECLTGFHPLWNPRVNQVDLRDNILNLVPLPTTQFRSDVPEPLQAVLARLLEKEPHLRYSKLEHLIEDLEAVELP
jgi:serine/threonine protein kinase